MDDFSEEPPTNINPYKILEIQPTASPSDVKSAYKKLALRHHPDKASPSTKDTAHTKFQEVAFAYAILSDERRRKRYDTTGNTSESLDLADDDFNWSDFFRAQYVDTVTGPRLDGLKSNYQNSEEEKRDVLKAYTASKGKLNAVFKTVMLSNPLDDEERFRGYIDRAIEAKSVEPYDAYTKETKKTRDERHRRAKREAKEAEEYAKDSGIYESIFGNGDSKSTKSPKKDGEPALADLIQQRHKGRATNFLDDLEAKYTGGKDGAANGKKGKKRARADEPSEEAFQKTAERVKRRKTGEVEAEVEIGDEDEVECDLADDDSEADEPKPKPTTKGKKKKPESKKDKTANEPPKRSSTRSKKPKTPTIEEEEDVDMDAATSDPEVVPKKAAKAKNSKRSKR